MMSATPEQELPPPPPPQPPLHLSDPAFSPAVIVHGIDRTGSTPPRTPHNPYKSPSTDSVSHVFNTLSSRFSRAIKMSRNDLSRTIGSVVPSMSDMYGEDQKQPALFLFGDSITERAVRVSEGATSPGWAALLRETYGEKVDVFVRGFSGYSSRWGIRILPPLYEKVKNGVDIKAVTIFFGANDAVDQLSHNQHVPLYEYIENLTAMVNYLKTQPVPPLPILITPPALSPNRNDGKRHVERTAKYAALCVDTAHKLGIPVVDLHTTMSRHAGGFEHFLEDGLHLSDKGNQLVYDLLLDVIVETLPEINPKIPRQFPPYDLIDLENPDKSLGLLGV